MSHYLKLLLDCIFGENNFRNEIIWFYKTGGTSKRYFARKHDVLLFYSKSNIYIFNTLKIKSYLSHKYGLSNVTVIREVLELTEKVDQLFDKMDEIKL